MLGGCYVAGMTEFDLSLRPFQKTFRTPKVGYGYFQYSSRPRCQPEASRRTRPNYKNCVDIPRGAHDYYNVMWDPHVYRGKTFLPFQQVERERAKEIQNVRRCRRRKKRYNRIEFGPLPCTPPPPPIESYTLNLDQFIIEAASDDTTKDVAEQTYQINRKPAQDGPVQAKHGFDVATHIEDGDTFIFDIEVTPIADVMTMKILNQGVRESMEEEELEALRAEQRMYEERRRLDELRTSRLQEREQLRQKRNEQLMNLMEEQRRTEETLQARVAAAMFTKSFLGHLPGKVLDRLTHEGFIIHVDPSSLSRDFTPWLNSAVEIELSRLAIAESILDSVMKQISFNRELEFASGQLMSRFGGSAEGYDTYDMEGQG